MATGANTTPLGRLHPILAAARRTSEEASTQPNAPLGSQAALNNNPELRAHLEAAKRAASALFSEEPAKKKRRSRWGGEDSRTVIPGLPTVLPSNLSEQQQKLYLLHLRIEDLSRRLRTDDLGIPPNPLDRSPSPEPIYSSDGKRLNTREFRARKKLEDDRHECIQDALTINPDYKPPADYKAPTKKFEDKIFIPQEDHPQTNFVGLLIGPRGNTLKQLEKETNCKIMIRGKGATKQGKYNPLGIPQPGEDEELHALISAVSPEDLKVGMDKVKSIIQSGIDNPGNENDLKRMQMMQLAELNGTFRPLDILKCSNCGSTTHRTWECSEGQNVTSSIICTRCGGGGHVALDCKVDLSTLTEQPSVADKAKMDSEYQSLMKELGEPVPEKKEAPQPSTSSSGGVAYPPPAPLIGMNNPNGIQPADPTTAAPPPWAPMMPVPPPPPGAPPFPILLPPVPLPWLGQPLAGSVPPVAGIAPSSQPDGTAISQPYTDQSIAGVVPPQVAGVVPPQVAGVVPPPVAGIAPPPVAGVAPPPVSGSAPPPPGVTSTDQQHQQQHTQLQAVGWPLPQPVGGASYPPLPLPPPTQPIPPISATQHAGPPPPPPEHLMAPPPPPPTEPPPPPPPS